MPRDKNAEPASPIDLDALEPLCLREQEFVRCIIQDGKTATDAYIATHDTAGMSRSAIWCAASRLRASARIRDWSDALMMLGMHRGAITQEEFLGQMQALGRRAEAAGNYGAAVNALAHSGKVAGLYIEQHMDVSPGTDLHQLLDGIEALLGQEARQTAARQLGLSEEEH